MEHCECIRHCPRSCRSTTAVAGAGSEPGAVRRETCFSNQPCESHIILRRAITQDLPFLLELEQRFFILGLVNRDDADTHRQKMADTNCAYFIAEEAYGRVGYVVLHGLTEASRSV